MDNRFSRLFNLTEAQAIEVLDGAANDSDEASNRYIAASHLVNFDTPEAIAALVRAVQNDDDDLDNRIVRRKAVESLGRLKAASTLSVIANCLNDADNYLVENAAWAIDEIGTDDQQILETLAQQLDRDGQSYRTIIHTLAKAGYTPAAERIERFTHSEQAPIASAAFSALYRLKGDERAIAQVKKYLQSTNVNARRGSIQDLIDADYYQAIPHIAQCPVSMVFRLRGISLLGQSGIASNALTFTDIQPILEKTLKDHPNQLALVHRYDQAQTLPSLVQALYGTDFGRCYLATKTLIETYPEEAPAALIESYKAEGYNDYGAHYHIMRLFGWLQVSAAYDLLVEALNNKAPQFQKSRTAAAIALAELGNPQAIPELRNALTIPIWDLQYAALLALTQLNDPQPLPLALDNADLHWLVRAKLSTI
ncbi:MAG: HEAT repeat domain-containing protein [Cyanobacteria bacterium P01_D01_bin.105]